MDPLRKLKNAVAPYAWLPEWATSEVCTACGAETDAKLAACPLCGHARGRDKDADLHAGGNA